VEDPERGFGAVTAGKSGEKRDRGPEKVSEVLGDFLERSGLREPFLRAEAVDQWEERMGEAIARVTRAQGIRGTSLVVEVRSSAWLMELNLMKGEILHRVNEGRQEALIEKIVFVLAEDPSE
jgi:predicted nucleic acid-binding Zn ribbon protein